MAEVKWIKLSVNMFEDEKIKLIRKMPEGNNILLVWIYILVLAGKCNDSGFVYLAKDVPYTDEMLSTVIDMPLNTVRLAVETFKKLRMIEITNDNKILVVNWEKHQNIEGLEKIREQNRLRKRRQREREKERQKALEEPEKNNSHVTSRDSHATDKNRLDKNREEKEKEDTTPPTPYKKIKDLFNSICKSYSKVVAIGSARERHLQARWKQFNFDLSVFEKAFKKLEESDFCKGANKRGWKADFDWVIKNSDNMVKTLEGKYDNDKGGGDDGGGKGDHEHQGYDFGF